MTNISADIAEKKKGTAEYDRQNFIDTHDCYLLEDSSSNDVRMREGFSCLGRRIGGPERAMYCVPLELGSILDHENQRYIAED
jgi:hypothetical protein